MATKSTKSSKATTAAAAGRALVDVEWLASHIDDPDLRLVHVSTERRTYNKRHVTGAIYSDLRELALRGTAPETGPAPRDGLVPSRDQTAALLRRWRVGEADRLVFIDDIGRVSHAARAYWLLRLYGYPAERLHVVDGGIEAWQRTEQATTTEIPEADLADGLRQPATLGDADETLIATYDHVREWSRESTGRSGGPTRLLDVRSAAGWVGEEVGASRGGHVPGARLRTSDDFLTTDGTLRPIDAVLSLLRASGVDPAEVRAVYDQDGVRAALGWFILHELAGLDDVALYAGGWEDWGNREGSPIEAP